MNCRCAWLYTNPTLCAVFTTDLKLDETMTSKRTKIRTKSTTIRPTLFVVLRMDEKGICVVIWFSWLQRWERNWWTRLCWFSPNTVLILGQLNVYFVYLVYLGWFISCAKSSITFVLNKHICAKFLTMHWQSVRVSVRFSWR